MALRIRNATQTNTLTQENSNGAVKTKATTTGLTKRAALGEIGNVTRHITNSNKDGPEKKELKKPSTVAQKQSTLVAPRQTSSRLLQQTKQSLICKTTTLVKPSKVIVKPSTTSTSSIKPPAILGKPRARPPLLKTASTSSLILKSTFAPSRIDAPEVPENSCFIDIDKEAGSNPILLGEYAAEIYAFMREIETKFVVETDFLDGQQVTPKMRAIVVDWLVDVQLQYNLLTETLHLAIGIFDRFLQKSTTVTRKNLQLVGVTSMWIACKYEELFSPELENFVFITDRAYTKNDILKMEQSIHRALDFCYGQPLSIHFLRRYSSASKASGIHHIYAKFFLELALVSYRLRSVRPSMIGAIALYVSFCVVDDHAKPGKHIWSESLAFYSTYTYDDIKPYIPVLAQIIIDTKASKLQAVHKKYLSNKQHNVSVKVHQKNEILEKLSKLKD